MPVALVTGASGFVGSHLVDALLARGYSVRALVRDTSPMRWLENTKAEIVRGEITDPKSLPAAVEGVDVVFHAAGITKAQREIDYRRVNVMGTEYLARAAAESARPPSRFVLVSSLAAGGPSTADRPRCEADSDTPQGPYGRSKLAGERVMRSALGELPWTIVRPVAVYGPRDVSFLILARLARRGWVLRIAGGRQPVHVIHVEDLVRGTLMAAESPKAVGRTYYMAHPETTTWEALGQLMARARGKRAVPLRVPRSQVEGIGFLTRILMSPRGRNPLPRDRIRDLLAPAWTCDIARGQGEIGFSPQVTIAKGIPDLMTWYKREGFL